MNMSFFKKELIKDKPPTIKFKPTQIYSVSGFDLKHRYRHVSEHIQGKQVEEKA